MKKQINLSLKRLNPQLIFIMITCLLIVGSCKKEQINEQANNKINWARDYYNTSLNSIRPKSISSGSGQQSGSKSGKTSVATPLWQFSSSGENNGFSFVEVPLEYNNKITSIIIAPGQKPTEAEKKDIAFASFDILLIYKNKDGNIKEQLVSIIPDLEYLKKHINLKQNKLAKLDSEFSGYLVYNSWKGEKMYLERIENGLLVKTNGLGERIMERAAKAIAKSSQGTVMRATMGGDENCITVEYDDYWIEFWSQFANDGVPPNWVGNGTYTYCSSGGGNVDEIIIPLELKTDSLKAKFPCADKLIAQPILTSAVMSKFVEPFLSPQRPTVTYLTDNTLPWGNATTGGTFMLGNNGYDPNSNTGLSSIVRFNEKMLQNSSQLLIAATVVHETLHAYINYNIVMANSNYLNYQDSNWMVGLNNFYLMRNLPSNYSNHTMMLEDYFDKSMAVLQAWNAKQGFTYSMKDMASAMLYGLDTYDTGTSQTNINNINAVFQTVKTKYNITAADLNTFNKANLIATTNKLPTTGCN